jgi:hypothetical protein
MLEMKRVGKHDDESLKMSMKVLEINPVLVCVSVCTASVLDALLSLSNPKS